MVNREEDCNILKQTKATFMDVMGLDYPDKKINAQNKEIKAVKT